MRKVIIGLCGAVIGTQSATAGNDIALRVDGRADATAYVAGAENADAAVIVVHDWFGISDLTRQSTDRLADLGYRAMAVDLYGGEAAQDHERAGELSSTLDPDAAQDIMRSALQFLGDGDRPLAVVGYSMGSRTALRAGAENPEQVKAVGLIYGSGYDSIPDDLLAATGPILSISGGSDEWSFPQQVELEQRMRNLGNQIESYVYPGADHGFAQPLYDNGNNLDAGATDAMRLVLDAFLARHLRGTPSVSSQ